LRRGKPPCPRSGARPSESGQGFLIIVMGQRKAIGCVPEFRSRNTLETSHGHRYWRLSPIPVPLQRLRGLCFLPARIRYRRATARTARVGKGLSSQIWEIRRETDRTAFDGLPGRPLRLERLELDPDASKAMRRIRRDFCDVRLLRWQTKGVGQFGTRSARRRKRSFMRVEVPVVQSDCTTLMPAIRWR
jgi:hypothetical protein